MPAPRIMPGAEPFEHDGGPVGVLVVHGFTGTPQSMRGLAEAFAGAGHSVSLPRLPGHGTSLKDLAGTTWQDWTGEADRAYRALRERCETVFVAGLSMGGGITLWLAERHEDVAGIIAINPSVMTTDPRAKLTPLLGKLPGSIKGVANDIAEPGQTELAYSRVPLRAAGQLAGLWSAVRGNLAAVRCPALIFASRQDHVVEPENARIVEREISSQDKELVWLERSYHVATLDYDRDLIAERSLEFVAKRS